MILQMGGGRKGSFDPLVSLRTWLWVEVSSLLSTESSCHSVIGGISWLPFIATLPPAQNGHRATALLTVPFRELTTMACSGPLGIKYDFFYFVSFVSVMVFSL